MHTFSIHSYVGNNVHKIGGLAHYVQQALEEAKKHIKTATNVPPGATPTEGFDDTDSK